MAERSKHYDWFHGENNQQSPKRNLKNRAKITWKFTKIFLYFSLFFFTMWGCVQMFTHKINTAPAAGITFARGEENLSPQVNKITFKTDKANNIYHTFKQNVYIPGNTDEGKKTIESVNNQLKNDLGVSSPVEARDGGNYIISLNDSNILHDNRDKLLLYTSAQINPKEKYYSFDESKRLLISLWEQSPINLYSLKKEKDDVTIDYKYSIDLNSISKPTNELAFYFNMNIISYLVNNFYKNNDINFDQDISLNAGVKLNEAQITTINNRNKRIKYLLNILGLKYSLEETESASIKTTKNLTVNATPFGFRSKTNWRPITNWKLAWSKDGGTGPFYGFFVYPIAYMTNEIVDSMPYMKGWESLITIVLVVVTLSVLMFLLNFKNTLQQTRMQELSAKKAIIDAKYAPYKGNKQMENRQRQEVAALYKKEGISPLAQIGSMFLRMPFFLAMWRVIGSIDHLKTTEWMGVNFATTSWRALMGNLTVWNNGWAYFPIIVLAVGLQIISTLLPKILTKRRNKNRMNVQQKEAMKKSDRMQKIMMIVTIFFPLITSAGLQIYFIVRSLWTIFELSITHQILIKKKKRDIAKGIK